MTVREPNFTHLFAITTLFAVILTASVPFYCSTGWCCSRHAESEVMAVSSCCKEKDEHASVKTRSEATCCSQPKDKQRDDSCDTGCATGCCKIAGMSFVLTPLQSITFLSPISTLIDISVFDTGVELSDYIPKPPHALLA